jgi:hypothetical protein
MGYYLVIMLHASVFALMNVAMSLMDEKPRECLESVEFLTFASRVDTAS